MRKCELVLLAVGVLALMAAPAYATTIRVPSDQPTIQAGVDAAVTEGDTVLVAPGTYFGVGNRDIEFTGVNIVLTSEDGAHATIIDCEGLDRGFGAYSGEDSTAVFSGFTVMNGDSSTGRGGGIEIRGAAVTIEHCIIRGNQGNNGGGIYYGRAPTQGFVRNCVIFGNTATFRGGGIHCGHGYEPDYVPVVVRDCVIYNNLESVGDVYGGGGIYCGDSDATIVGCTVVGNSGEPGRGAIYGYSCTPVVRRTVSAFNVTGPGVAGVDADHCIIYGNPGDVLPSGRDRENLAVDPLFCDVGTWDLTVCADSPCLAGDPENPWGERIGVYGSGCGDCDSAVEESTWGAIKALYLHP